VVTRVLLAVAIAAALLAVSLPAVETARADRTAAALDRTVERIASDASSLHADDDADAGARRVVPVTLPRATVTATGVDQFAIGCRDRCAVRYQLSNGRHATHRMPSVPLVTPAGRVAFSKPGTHRLVLGLTRKDGRRVVTVRG